MNRFIGGCYLILSLLGSTGCCLGQASYAPTVTQLGADPDENPIFDVRFPDGSRTVVVGQDELGTLMVRYAGGVSHTLFSIDGGTPPAGPGPVGNGGGLLSGLDSELSQVLGIDANSIMAGLQAQITALAQSLIASVVDASPIGEVETMNRLLKDAYSKQQKIQYQGLKLQLAEKKAHTDLSTAFIGYYTKLDLPSQLARVIRQKNAIDRLAGSRLFSNRERQGITDVLNQVSGTADLEEDVRSACNLNGETVWMSEAERIQVLDAARDQLVRRQRILNAFRVRLANAYASRTRRVARNKRMAALFKANSALNRYVRTTKQSL